jgi:hypothetical protein
VSVEAPRGLTHAKRLLEPEAWVERITVGWDALHPKHAMLLVQLHPQSLPFGTARPPLRVGREPSQGAHDGDGHAVRNARRLIELLS